MNQDHLRNQILELRKQGTRILDAHEQRRRELDRDTAYTEDYKREQHALYAELSRAELRTLKDREAKLVSDAVRDVERRLDSKTGNTANDIIAFRDAQDRAERLDKPEEANRILSRALHNDDTSLAHAVFRRAVDANWGSVIDQFTAEVPSAAEDVRALVNLREEQSNSFGRTAHYALIH